MRSSFVADTSSLILLSKAQILRKVTSEVKILITNEVVSEINAGLDKGKFDALVTNQLIEEGRILIKDPERATIQKVMDKFDLGAGEASVIALQIDKKFTGIVTDDNAARKTAKILGIKIISSLHFPLMLYNHKKISFEKAEITLKILEKEGWFGDKVMRESYSLLGNLRDKGDVK